MKAALDPIPLLKGYKNLENTLNLANFDKTHLQYFNSKGRITNMYFGVNLFFKCHFYSGCRRAMQSPEPELTGKTILK